MKKWKLLVVYILVTFIFSSFDTKNCCSNQIRYEFGNHQFIMDKEDLLTFKEKRIINKKVESFFKASSSKILLLTVADITPYNTLEEYTNAFRNNYRGKNIGVIFTVSKKMRSIWIATSVTVERFLTDKKLGKIIDQKILPKLKEGSYFEGINGGIDECIELLSNS